MQSYSHILIPMVSLPLSHSHTSFPYYLISLHTIMRLFNVRNCSSFSPPTHSSLQQLITKNADYLVNSVALQLRSSVSPEAIQVLQAVLKYG